MSKEAKIVSIEYVPGPNVHKDETLMYGSNSGRPLAIGDTVTEEDGDVVIVRSARGVAIPTASIHVAPAVKVSL